MTMQTFVIFLIGMTYSVRLSLLTLVAYLFVALKPKKNLFTHMTALIDEEKINTFLIMHFENK